MMKNSIFIFPTQHRIGDLFEVALPFYQLPVGTLAYLFLEEGNSLNFITEEKHVFAIKKNQTIAYMRYLQFTGYDYTYTPMQFTEDLNSSYFPMLFKKFKQYAKKN